MLTKNDLLALGLLLDRPMHGYEISRHVKTEGVDTWYDISTPAVYYSLNKLHQQGLIREIGSRRGDGEKTVYHVTEKGREQFFAGMEETLTSREPVRFEYDLGIFLLNKLPRSRALSLLEQRMDFLRHRSATLDEALEQERESGEPLRVAILEHAAACAGMEKRWLGGIIQHLRGEETAGEREREYAGLMLLTGHLRDFHLPDLIKLIASGKHSGTLTVTDGGSTRTLTFREGRPVCATSRRSNGEVGDQEQVMEDIYDLFRWQEGKFTFDQRMGPQKGCQVSALSAHDLILRGCRWVDNWATIQQIVPSPDSICERRDGKVQPEDLDLTQGEHRVLDALDGLRDVSAVARVCELTEFETSKILYGLAVVGLVQPGDLDKARLRRVFREFAELMCQGTLPYRDAPNDSACEEEVNQRCGDLPIRFVAGRIEDQTDPGLRTQELAGIYRVFLRTQCEVVGRRFGGEVAERLCQQVLPQISPSLRGTLERYDLVKE